MGVITAGAFTFDRLHGHRATVAVPNVPVALRRVALIGNHLPRQCGIATFSTDLTAAIAQEFPTLDVFMAAMNDLGHKHAYPPVVRLELRDTDATSYQQAADYLNVSNVDVVSLQHEYGIFGGVAGSMILPLLRELRMPIVTTLHTILAEPDAVQRRVMQEIVQRSERLVVMSQHGAAVLRRVHGASDEKIDVIPHGIPDVMFEAGSKERIGLAGRAVLLTFGLLSPDKGIEHVIDALPAILQHHPELVYVVLGATHPHVLESAGESYRLMLEARARRLGVDGSVIFHNRFVSQDELAEFLTAADIYITPYHNLEQSTSGTLAYAVGAGKAVISTPYRYARELLDDGCGLLVPVRDAGAIAHEILRLLDHPEVCSAMQSRARMRGRAMHWGAVARRHVAGLERAVTDHARRRRRAFHARTLAERPVNLPTMELHHLRAMTDDTGLIQHALYTVPRYAEGYCIDDNARALLLTVLLEEDDAGNRRQLRSLASRYLAFVSHAFDPLSGRFRNFLTYDRQWIEPHGSDDSHGRTVWSLGALVGRALDPSRRSLAGELFHAAVPATRALRSPRAWAYALLGIDEYLRAFAGDRGMQRLREDLVARLLDLYTRVAGPNWPWFENSVTYCNARLSQAMLLSGEAMGRPDLVQIGLDSLRWLGALQQDADGWFAPIGSNGFLPRGGTAARFDQQPVEACGMVAAALAAHRITADAEWRQLADRAFAWFTGGNHLQQSLADPATGGCRDGLHADRINENQGAESTLSYLLALQHMRAAARSAAT